MDEHHFPELFELRRLVRSGEARRIREAEDQASIREYAAFVGVSHTTLARWEHGRARPRGSGALRWYRLLTRHECDGSKAIGAIPA